MLTQMDALKLRLANEPQLQEDVLKEVLENAKNIILLRRFPLSEFPYQNALEDKYLGLQIDIAVELYSRRGAEGETSHVENGVTRNYGSSTVSSELLRRIVPKGAVK